MNFFYWRRKESLELKELLESSSSLIVPVRRGFAPSATLLAVSWDCTIRRTAVCTRLSNLLLSVSVFINSLLSSFEKYSRTLLPSGDARNSKKAFVASVSDCVGLDVLVALAAEAPKSPAARVVVEPIRSEEHTSELQS